MLLKSTVNKKGKDQMHILLYGDTGYCIIWHLGGFGGLLGALEEVCFRCFTFSKLQGLY
jgi:hypothetical protein